ncbi:hypothetical protein MLD38_030187 [Melastoma candidum]|uniref:Uncharacterized protein n=1 Tax=Melastoma candidum TaxID=119954 RepID=A0ACB9MMY5_9MYRT|nr:hypothetical protein MLD38_030187 [Melastoma candidum]
MHDLIREMGREIVRSESLLLRSPGMKSSSSRLWDWKEARDVVRQKQELPSSLTKLSIVHCSQQLFSNLASLTNLTELELEGACDHLSGIEKLHRLQKLKLDVGDKPVPLSTELGSLSRLEELCLTSSDISSISQLPSSLRELTLVGFKTELLMSSLIMRSAVRLVLSLAERPASTVTTLLYYSDLLPRHLNLERLVLQELLDRENYLFRFIAGILRCF